MRDPAVSRFAAGQLGPHRRAADLRRLGSAQLDVLVVGGGVTGAGAALDAAARGLSVGLVEARDLAAGTSSRSTKLVHGGLRYLEQLEFGLVHEALAERDRLATRLAPHLVRPVPILAPLPPGRWPVRAARRLYYGAGVALYDGFAGLVGSGRAMPRHRHLSRAAVRRVFPDLRPEAVAGGIRFYDGQVDDARLVVTVARTAASLGAAVVTGCRVVRLLLRDGEITGARVRERESGAEFTVAARTVVLATGVWADEAGTLLGGAPAGAGRVAADPPGEAAEASEASEADGWVGPRVRASKGVHLVVPRAAITGEVGLILRTPDSVLFALPWGGHWIIGTTDTAYDDDRSAPTASARDVDYLLGQLNQVLRRPVGRSQIEGVYAGLRPLLAGERPAPRRGLLRSWSGEDATSTLSRRHAVLSPVPGLFVVTGGKLTTYRTMAADVVDRAAARLGAPAGSPTGRLPLLGADGYRVLWRDRASLARRHGLPPAAVARLIRRYGSLTVELLRMIDSDPALAVPVAGAPAYLAVEIAYAARAESARHLDDVLARRTRIAIETRHRGTGSARHVAALVGAELGWSPARQRQEVRQYREAVRAQRAAECAPVPPSVAAITGGDQVSS